jgi:hypothetical protein
MSSHDARADAELLAATRREPEAFAVFYERYRDAVVGYFMNRTRRPDLAADLTAETFAAALAAADGYRGSGGAAGWLFQIARSKLVDSVRRGRVEDGARRAFRAKRGSSARGSSLISATVPSQSLTSRVAGVHDRAFPSPTVSLRGAWLEREEFGMAACGLAGLMILGWRTACRAALPTRRLRRALTIAVCLALGALPGIGLPAVAQAATVKHAQQISSDTLSDSVAGERDTQGEPSIALDPRDPSRVVSLFQVRRYNDGGSAAIGYATSHDGGATWVRGSLPGLTRASGGAFPRASNPTVAFGPDGSVYAESLLVTPSRRECVPASRTAVAVQRSTDGGLSFGAPVLVEDDRAGCGRARNGLPFRGALNDKPWLAVDTGDGPHRGRLYLVWTQLPGTLVERHSDDNGMHWSARHRIPFPGEATGAIALVGPDGNLTIVFNNDVPHSDPVAYVISSSDGATSWGKPRQIEHLRAGGPYGIRLGPPGGFPAAAVDPTDGAIYVAWRDDRFRRARYPHSYPDILISGSRDGGSTWSPPRRVSARVKTSTVQNFMPAVAAYAGDVSVSYLAAREGSRLAQPLLSVSHDGGTTFGGAVRLGPLLNLRYAARTCFGCGTRYAEWNSFLGDYMGIAAGPGVAHAVWPRPSRRGTADYHQTTWSTTVDWSQALGR